MSPCTVTVVVQAPDQQWGVHHTHQLICNVSGVTRPSLGPGLCLDTKPPAPRFVSFRVISAINLFLELTTWRFMCSEFMAWGRLLGVPSVLYDSAQKLDWINTCFIVLGEAGMIFRVLSNDGTLLVDKTITWFECISNQNLLCLLGFQANLFYTICPMVRCLYKNCLQLLWHLICSFSEPNGK